MPHTSIDARTVMGLVSLTVSNLERSERFYTEVIGLQVLDRSASQLFLGAESDFPLLSLTELPDAPKRPARSTGLYHFALLHPSRYELARTLRRLIDSDWPLTGLSDHLVSEAIYLDDPNGIGIELYSDRPRSEWIHRDGGIVMAVDPLDVGSLLAELTSSPQSNAGMPAGMTMGHVHLNVSDIPSSQRFYCDVLGFNITFHMHSALFISAGGYHHHLGLNTWNGVGAPAPVVNTLGLRHYTVLFGDQAALDDALGRLNAAGDTVVETIDGFWVKDPAQNQILLKVQ